ncbi:hypothetical protein VNO77_04025 [Canavalia gladiata]|uniref:Uncharacterized protein n=1 Tax=Canavalia gladiata TaxID=3824 RepID=A0AAN9MXV5_CANGL
MVERELLIVRRLVQAMPSGESKSASPLLPELWITPSWLILAISQRWRKTRCMKPNGKIREKSVYFPFLLLEAIFNSNDQVLPNPLGTSERIRERVRSSSLPRRTQKLLPPPLLDRDMLFLKKTRVFVPLGKKKSD